MTREIAVWDENPEQKYSQEELGGILDDAVQSLKPTFRTVFVLRDIEELSTEETAEALGTLGPGGEKPPAARPAAAAGKAHPFLQAQGGRRICLHVKNF